MDTSPTFLELLHRMQKDVLSERLCCFPDNQYLSKSNEEMSTTSMKESFKRSMAAQTSTSRKDMQTDECEVDTTVTSDFGNDDMNASQAQTSTDDHLQQIGQVSQHLVTSYKEELQDSNTKYKDNEFQKQLMMRNVELQQHFEKAKLMIEIQGYCSYITNLILEKQGNMSQRMTEE